jgi:4-oxalocrotonate tautomerase
MQLMPHIDIKCYPKHLSEAQFEGFIKDLTALMQQHLHVQESDLSINYTEVPNGAWKTEVWDAEIKPNMEHLAKKPGYSMD